MSQSKPLKELIIAIKGAGDLASGIAWSLFQAHLRKLLMLEVPEPLRVRRTVCFCEALIDGWTDETISDKSRAIGRAVLEAILRVYNK